MTIKTPVYTETKLPKVSDTGNLGDSHIPVGAGSVVNGVVNMLPPPVEISQVVNGKVVK